MSKINITINRRHDIGEYHITDVFSGLENNPIFLDIFKDGDDVAEVFEKTAIKIIERDTYMFVDNDNGTINIGIDHLKTSDETVLYLDIIHELVHVRQQREGLDLYDRSVAYVDRSTEIEAYMFTVAEARRIGLNDKEIMDYLEVEWVTPQELMRLAKRLNVSV